MDIIEIKNQIEKLIEKTKAGRVDWKQLNQNLIRWVVSIDGGLQLVTTLQYTPMGMVNNKPIQQYIFTIQSGQFLQPPVQVQQLLLNNEMLMQIQANPQLNTEFVPLLQDLFEFVIEKIRKQTVAIYCNILDNLK